jgi:dimethylhistidine N-methyltransferase
MADIEQSKSATRELNLYQAETAAGAMRREVIEGLSRPQKQISPKYFYDERGSRLFDQICQLDEYYLTRTELSIMRDSAAEMAACVGPGSLLIEYGCGNGEKTRLLLEELSRPAAFVPIDISGEHLRRTALDLLARFPGLEVLPVCADFTGAFDVPRCRAAVDSQVGYFPGSTIGNFTPRRAAAFLAGVARRVGPGGGLLIGVDLKKDIRTLERAYNDADGITAQFNLNALAHINDRLHANFQLDQFRHRAFFNADEGRIEMHLESLADQTVAIDGHEIHFTAGETIHTESSYKYELDQFARLAGEGGFDVAGVWTDPLRWFSVQYLRVR